MPLGWLNKLNRLHGLNEVGLPKPSTNAHEWTTTGKAQVRRPHKRIKSRRAETAPEHPLTWVLSFPGLLS